MVAEYVILRFDILPRSVVRRQTGFAARITRTLSRLKSVTSPYQPPKLNSQTEGRTRLSTTLLYSSVCFLGGLLVINTLGWAFYLNVHTGMKDLVLGTNSGVIHLALGDCMCEDPPLEEDPIFQMMDTGLDYFELLRVGPFRLACENSSDIRGFWRAYGSLDPNYQFVDVPILAPLALGCVLLWRNHRKRGQNASG